MAIDWPTSTLKAIRRVTSRTGTAFFTRKELISQELDQIAAETETEGATPHQTLSRILQDLRDAGHLRFLGRGEYELLHYRPATSALSSTEQEPATEKLPEIISPERVMLPPKPPVAVDIGEPSPPDRANVTVRRIIRDTKIVEQLKVLYEFRCQICGFTIELTDGRCYCEAHHIRPLGSPHDGADITSNIIVVCPNHHAMLDYGAIPITAAALLFSRHHIGDENIEYHNTQIQKTANKRMQATGVPPVPDP